MKRKNSIQENFSIQKKSIGDLIMEVKDYSLNINGQDVVFENHPAWEDSIKTTLQFANGYSASIITKRSGADQSYSSWSAGGDWDNMTFEVALLKDGSFIFDEEIEDREYKYNSGVWKYIHLEDMNEILSAIKNR
jgi:hypothetical protein